MMDYLFSVFCESIVRPTGSPHRPATRVGPYTGRDATDGERALLALTHQDMKTAVIHVVAAHPQGVSMKGIYSALGVGGVIDKHRCPRRSLARIRNTVARLETNGQIHSVNTAPKGKRVQFLYKLGKKHA